MEESDVRLALAAGDMHDQLLVAYHLILDNRRINAEGILLNLDIYLSFYLRFEEYKEIPVFAISPVDCYKF